MYRYAQPVVTPIRERNVIADVKSRNKTKNRLNLIGRFFVFRKDGFYAIGAWPLLLTQHEHDLL